MKGKDILRKVEFLIGAENEVQRIILKTAGDEFIIFLGEIALNILEEVIPLSKYFKKKLRSHAQFIRDLGAKKKVKIEHRRRLCVRNSSTIVLMLKAAHSELKDRFL